MQNLLSSIVKNQNITTLFQPIVDIKSGQAIGYEALSRGPKNSPLYSPETLFSMAMQQDLLSEVEILCRDSAIRCFAKFKQQLKLSAKLFLNISPMILLDSAHPQGKTVALVEKSGLECEDIVIEITEKYPYPNGNLLHKALAKYQQFGFEVAIDDLGAGYSGLTQWCSLQPNIVKIDRFFIQNCDQSSHKQAFLQSLFTLGNRLSALVIAEGIETQGEFELLVKLGMRYAQGFYIGKPQQIPQQQFQYSALIPNQPQLDLVIG